MLELYYPILLRKGCVYMNNTITVSFKVSEVHYLTEFKSMYAVPTAIIKDFIIDTVRNKNKGTNVTSMNINNQYNNNDIDNNDIDLLDF